MPHIGDIFAKTICAEDSMKTTEGSITLDGTGYIVAKPPGKGRLELSNLVKSAVNLTTDLGEFETPWFYADTEVAEIGIGATSGCGITIQMDTDSVYDWDEILIKKNDVNDSKTEDKDKMAVLIGCRNGTIESGVRNSICLGGVNTYAKNNNTAYVQNLGFATSSSAEGILTSTPTIDRVWTIPDMSGTLCIPFVSTIVGDGVTSAFTITHNKNNMDVMIQVYSITTGQNIFTPDIERLDANNVRITFGAAPVVSDNYKVIIL